MQVSGMRNENVAVNPIDNNAIKEVNVRLGATITLVTEPRVESTWFATEFGRPAGALLLLQPVQRPASVHGELFYWHQNSVFNARTFFQVGSVLPSRRNQHGGRFTAQLGERTGLTANLGQRDVRGMVNGNVLVPLASERTPLSTDPRIRTLVQSFLNAYPGVLPNRPDFDARALNTNAPQRIDDLDGNVRLDHDAGSFGKLHLFYLNSRARTDAFQLVAGQNPDSEIHNHRAQLSWRHSIGSETDLVLGAAFTRTRSDLVPEPNAVGTRIRIGYQIEELGPESEYPVNRSQNAFRYGGDVAHRRADRHELRFGGDVTRFQLNGIETSNLRGQFNFTNNFGRTAIENLRMGTPAFFEATTGEMARGFRTWGASLYVSDRWKMAPRLQLYYGLRYNLSTAPSEVNGLNAKPYACDCNNFSPRLALAWQMGRGWVLRSGYAVSFGEIQPVTYQQIRFNLPHTILIQVQNPDLLNPFDNVTPGSHVRTTPTNLSPDLVAPYVHQYNLSLERKLSAATIRLSYIGDRSLKLMNSFITNRADPVPGIPLTLDTVDARRPDPRYYDVRTVVNGGTGHFNAGQASIEFPSYRRLRVSATYTFSKAIDEGSDYTVTAANRDMLRARSQWQYESFGDKRSLSTFDSPHSLLTTFTFDVPRLAGWARFLTEGWQLAGVSLVKTGTPLTLFVGSDAPGFGNVDGGPSDRPNILDPAILGTTISHPDKAPLILSRDRFGYIQPGQNRGSVGRNTFRKARISNFNAAVSKQWHWAGGGREWTAQLRAEAYNLTNTPQFDEPQRNLSSPAFGKITNTLNDGRVYQLGLRLTL
jgi:hypothetical protein